MGKFKKDLHTVENHLLMLPDYLPIKLCPGSPVVHLASLLVSSSHQMLMKDWFMIYFH